MNLIKQILINEIKDAIGHKPNAAEFKSCLEYVYNNLDDNSMIIDVERNIKVWRDDNCFKCDQCKEYFLTDQLQDTDDGKFCSDECIMNYQDYKMSDYELRTY
jgi:hypothetical protein